jgi:hypothetical protein
MATGNPRVDLRNQADPAADVSRSFWRFSGVSPRHRSYARAVPRRRTSLRRIQPGDPDAERRRQLIARARANGVSYEQRDGRTFTVLHLEPERRAAPQAGSSSTPA